MSSYLQVIAIITDKRINSKIEQLEIPEEKIVADRIGLRKKHLLLCEIC